VEEKRKEKRSFWQVNSRKIKSEIMAGREARNTDRETEFGR